MEELRFPERYGTDDVVGAANEITPEKVLNAIRGVRSGERYHLARILDEHSPTQMSRYWKHSLGLDRVIPGRFLGANSQSYVEETVAGALHSGTHIDGLGHVGVGEHAYNGARYAEISTSQGLSRYGIENVPPLVTRGVLLNIARALQVDMLADRYVITPEDLAAAERMSGVRLEPGDAVILHTGWGSLWMVDNQRYTSAEPGIGVEAAKWLTDRRISVIGADNWAVEAVPAADDTLAFPVHQHCIALYGVYLIENMLTEELVKDGVDSFLFIALPPRLRGASGSPVAPVAII